MNKTNLHIIIILLIALNSNQLKSEYTKIEYDTIPRDFFFFPKAYDPLELGANFAIGVTRLPVQVVEEEISYSPMPILNLRLGLSKTLSALMQINSNYISNHASLGIMKSYSLGDIYFSLGTTFSAWFGHIQLDAIKLKTWGVYLTPNAGFGFDFGSLFFSTQFETQHHIFWTYAENQFLGVLKKFDGGFAVKFCAEQPLWNKHWVSLSLKLNYSKFYYQSWLSYSTVDEYLFYPEFNFGFTL